MPKHARSASSASTDDSQAIRPAKRRACSTPPRSPPSPPTLTAAETQTQGCTLALTLDNLAQHTCASASPRLSQSDPSTYVSSPSMSSRSGSPTRHAWDTRATLQSYHIDVDTHHALPLDLQTHLDTVLRRPREGPPSPNAKRVVQHRLAASLENESTGIRRLEPLLLFAGEDDPSAANPVPLISSKLTFNLSREFLPPVPAGRTLPKLSQPQADTIIGYLSNLQVIDPPLATAFTPEEEDALADFTLNPVLVFPFLSSQWKPATGESHMIAHYQSARDGAAIVRYLDEFYKTAYGRPATTLECSHLSFTCDIQALNIWLHWRELDATGTAKYYMRSIESCTLRKEKDLKEIRALLWNHVDYALDARLRSLKLAIASFSTEFPKRKLKIARTAGSSRGSVRSEPVALMPISLPPTPSSNHDDLEPVKRASKRRRDNDETNG